MNNVMRAKKGWAHAKVRWPCCWYQSIIVFERKLYAVACPSCGAWVRPEEFVIVGIRYKRGEI
jgi:hypothetical protein